MPPATVPRKPLGKFYAVVLRSPDFSHGNVARKGGLGGKDVVPVPDFGALCVCCEADVMGRAQRVALTDPGGHLRADPVDVPICAGCADHAIERTRASIMAGAALRVGAPVAVLGFFFYDLPAVGIADLVITAATVAWPLRSKRARLAHTRGGPPSGARPAGRAAAVRRAHAQPSVRRAHGRGQRRSGVPGEVAPSAPLASSPHPWNTASITCPSGSTTNAA